MSDVTVTVLGTICSEVRYHTAGDSGVPIARFQIRSHTRRFDRRTEKWTDGEPSYYSVTCWRRLAEHAASSLGVGDPVVATGRLRISRWKRYEEIVISAELEAQSVGHDLRWGTTVYRRNMVRVGMDGERPEATGRVGTGAGEVEASVSATGSSESGLSDAAAAVVEAAAREGAACGAVAVDGAAREGVAVEGAAAREAVAVEPAAPEPVAPEPATADLGETAMVVAASTVAAVDDSSASGDILTSPVGDSADPADPAEVAADISPRVLDDVESPRVAGAVVPSAALGEERPPAAPRPISAPFRLQVAASAPSSAPPLAA